jgi:hypothetical protein
MNLDDAIRVTTECTSYHIEVGTPVELLYNGHLIYGRAVELKGEEMSGEHSIIAVATPHGSIITTGRAHIKPIEDNHPRLLEFEVAALRFDPSRPLYAGKLD